MIIIDSGATIKAKQRRNKKQRGRGETNDFKVSLCNYMKIQAYSKIISVLRPMEANSTKVGFTQYLSEKIVMTAI
jgi:hypothetical protein